MGEVYLARDTRLDRTVAVKILPAHLSSNLEAKQRFDREARAISSLNHPNICTLHDVGHQDGTDFLVMEYLEGETLADRLMKGPLSPEQVLKYGIEICEGLEKAHKSGVVHRDLKPGNIMLTKSGAKLMDFGLAKATPAHEPPASSLTMTLSGPSGQPLTAQGTVLGTFQYMAPEQLEGKEADARSDIFALGAVSLRDSLGQAGLHGQEPGQHCGRHPGFRAAADFGGPAHVSARARPRGQDLHGEGSRRPLANRSRRQIAAAMDCRGWLEGRYSHACGGAATNLAEDGMDDGRRSNCRRSRSLPLLLCCGRRQLSTHCG